MKFIDISKFWRLFFLALITITSIGYAYIADGDAAKTTDQLSFLDWVLLQPTAVAASIMQDRIKADILAFMFWFVFQACGLVALYFACCIAISRPGSGGKDL